MSIFFSFITHSYIYLVVSISLSLLSDPLRKIDWT